MITCGDGDRDRVLADQYDVYTDATLGNTGSCERVRVRDASTESDAPENETEEEPEDEREGLAGRSSGRGPAKGPLF